MNINQDMPSLLVAAALEAGSHRANAINTIKMAEGFATQGYSVTLLCRAPASGPMKEKTLQKLYNLKHRIQWMQVSPKFLWKPLDPHWHFAIQGYHYTRKNRPDIVFARNYIFPWLTSKLGIPTITESHAHVDNTSRHFFRFINGTNAPEFRRLVTISQVLADYYQGIGVPEEKIMVQPDSVDTAMFRPVRESDQSPYQADAINIVYTGHLYDYKGIPTILESAKLCPRYTFHLVGGASKDIKRNEASISKAGLKNVRLHGIKNYSDVPHYTRHADVLLLPPSANHPSARWTSPVKLGEYLASGVPVVASSIPALTDWLDETECVFFTPDNPQSLTHAITKALDKSIAARLSLKGVKKAEEWTYSNRAKRILEGISQ